MKSSNSWACHFCIQIRPLSQQPRRIIKLTSIFLFLTTFQLYAHAFSQRVTFKGKDVPLQTVFASLEKQTGLSFFFNYDLIKETKPVTLNVKDATLEDALNEALKDQMLDFYQQGKTIFIVRKQMEKVLLESFSPRDGGEQLTSIKGRVTNEQGESLVAATVTVKNGKKATLTDERGAFELKGVPVGAVLQITFLGYQSKEIKITQEGNFAIQLVLANNKLDEAQVIAYGHTSQRLSTGNITMVKGEDIKKQPVSNPLLALEGRVPGLFITQSTGMPGTGVIVRIQGQNSIGNGNDPLYVIDGVPYVSQLLSTTLGTQLGNSGASTGDLNGNPMNFINPDDIENIEVLKDADATAIYGSRAANGAILITTKKGKTGSTKVELNLQNGWGGVTRKLSLLNTQQYLQMRHEALRNDGVAGPGVIDFDINGTWDTTRYTDWQKVLIGGTSQYANVSASVSGGNLNMQYIIGGTYHRETPVFPGSYSDVRGNVHFALTSVSTNQRLKMQLTGSYLYDNNQLPALDLTDQALSLPPDAPPIFNSDGTLNWQPLPPGSILPGYNTWTNPFATIYYNPYRNRTYNLVSNAVLRYQILPGLEVRTNLGYTDLQANEIYLNEFLQSPPATQISRGTNARAATYSNNTIRSWIIEPQAEYKHVAGYSAWEAMIGGTLLQNDANGQRIAGIGYNSDALLQDLQSAAIVLLQGSSFSQYKYSALFARLKYIWREKYIVDLVARRDGSSRFGPASQFHNFASVGAAWIFGQERIIKDNFSVLSFGKLRGSYGTTGNDQIGDYRFMNLYTSQSFAAPYQGVSGLDVRNLPNPYLQWEETRKLQAAIELGFWQNRILFTANYVRNRSSNQLLFVNLPQITGFPGIAENWPTIVQNTAGEFTLNISIFKRKNFSWECNANFTLPKNKLLSYKNQTEAGLVAIGRPLGFAQLYHSLGVDPSTGEYSFSDSHGGATSTPDPLTDRTKILNVAFPTYYGGIENSIRFKGVQLDFLFQFVKRLASNYSFGAQVPGTFEKNQPAFILNRWQKPGDMTSTQRFSANRDLVTSWLNEATSDAAISDASYVRLKNLSLSYQIPDRLLRRIRFQGMHLYVQGQNLLTITKFKGLDPETGNSVLPPLRVLTVGMGLEL